MIDKRKKTYLVVGATSNFGMSTANCLRSGGADVYSLQRKPLAGVDPQGTEGKFREEMLTRWLDFDIREPGDMPMAVHKLCTDSVEFDGVVLAGKYVESKDPDLVTAVDVGEHQMANMVNPLMLLKYMEDFNVLKPSSIIIFILGQRMTDGQYISYELSRVGFCDVARLFFERFQLQSRFVFIQPPREAVPESDDAVSNKVVRLLNDSELQSGTIVDLR